MNHSISTCPKCSNTSHLVEDPVFESIEHHCLSETCGWFYSNSGWLPPKSERFNKEGFDPSLTPNPITQ